MLGFLAHCEILSRKCIEKTCLVVVVVRRAHVTGFGTLVSNIVVCLAFIIHSYKKEVQYRVAEWPPLAASDRLWPPLAASWPPRMITPSKNRNLLLLSLPKHPHTPRAWRSIVFYLVVMFCLHEAAMRRPEAAIEAVMRRP